MKLSKAKILDALLLKFTGNVPVFQNDISTDKLNDVHPNKFVVENNMQYLLVHGLVRHGVSHNYHLTELGFSVMTEIKDYGFVNNYYKGLKRGIAATIISLITILTFLMLLLNPTTNPFLSGNNILIQPPTQKAKDSINSFLPTTEKKELNTTQKENLSNSKKIEVLSLAHPSHDSPRNCYFPSTRF